MITILTPTYNRAQYLKQVYNSLLLQTNHNFEWIIIDDGSIDDTKDTVSSFFDQNLFPIRYFYQKNGGKHRAINNGLKHAKYEYIYILDSDDILIENAVMFFINHLPEIQNSSFVGLAGLKVFENRKVIGNQKINADYIDATNIERTKFGLNGDKAELLKKKILLEYPFPEFENENFISESSSWDRIAIDGYKIRWFNQPVSICNYLEDGLTKNKNSDLKMKNYKGYIYCTILSLKHKNFPYNYLLIGDFCKVSYLLNKNDNEICELLGIKKYRLILGKIIYFARNYFRK